MGDGNLRGCLVAYWHGVGCDDTESRDGICGLAVVGRPEHAAVSLVK